MKHSVSHLKPLDATNEILSWRSNLFVRDSLGECSPGLMNNLRLIALSSAEINAKLQVFISN